MGIEAGLKGGEAWDEGNGAVGGCRSWEVAKEMIVESKECQMQDARAWCIDSCQTLCCGPFFCALIRCAGIAAHQCSLPCK